MKDTNFELNQTQSAHVEEKLKSARNADFTAGHTYLTSDPAYSQAGRRITHKIYMQDGVIHIKHNYSFVYSIKIDMRNEILCVFTELYYKRRVFIIDNMNKLIRLCLPGDAPATTITLFEDARCFGSVDGRNFKFLEGIFRANDDDDADLSCEAMASVLNSLTKFIPEFFSAAHANCYDILYRNSKACVESPVEQIDK